MSRITVGVVGAGVMGRRHLRALSGCSSAKLVGIVDHGDNGADLPDVPTRADLSELLDLRPEAVIVATPAGTHRPIVEDCLASGAHVLVEKPLAASAADARAMVGFAGHSGRLLAVGHVERFSSVTAAIRHAAGVAAPTSITTMRAGSLPRRVADVGVLLDLAVHDIDLVRWATGREYAEMNVDVQAQRGGGHETRARLEGVLDDGTLVTHEVSWLTHRPARRWTLVTNDGRQQSFDLLGSSTDALAAQDEAFLAACRGAPLGMLATGHDGAVAVDIALSGRAQDLSDQRAQLPSHIDRDAAVGANREREGLDAAPL